MTRHRVASRHDPSRGAAFDPRSYGAWYRTPLGSRVSRDERVALERLLPEVIDGPAADLGCGDGRWAIALRERGVRSIGLDLSMEMLRAARRRADDRGVRVSLVRSDAQRLPVRSRGVGLVTAVTLLSFVSDPAAVMREVERVLRPDGAVVLGELGRWSPWAAARRVRGWLGDPVWRAARFWTPGELRGLMEQAGLRAVAETGAVFYPRSERIARWLAPVERSLRDRTSVGAAFIAVAGRKVGPGRQPRNREGRP